MSLFAWCAVIGCAALAIGIVFDSLLDSLLPDGLIPILAVALAVFGATGMAAQALAGSQGAALVVWCIPGGLGLISATATAATWKRLRRSMPLDSAAPCAPELIGEKVDVLWWKDGAGEVRAVVRGNQLTIAAHSQDALSSGQTAWVVDAEDTTLLITPWEQTESRKPYKP